VIEYVSKHFLCERKAARLLHELCFSAILSDGILSLRPIVVFLTTFIVSQGESQSVRSKGPRCMPYSNECHMKGVYP
jgi:hypothetical protein